MPSDKPRIVIDELAYKYRYPILLLLVGVSLIGLGVLVRKSSPFSESKVEILERPQPTAGQTELVVEIAGAIEKPGVYKFPDNSRIEDLLIASGGFSADADREWIGKVINRAAKLIDGQKLYIPKEGEQTLGESAKNEGDIKVYQVDPEGSNGGMVNINTSSQKALEDLPGIGPVYAQSIIEHRPYSTTEDLVSKGALKQGVFEKVKDLITIY